MQVTVNGVHVIGAILERTPWDLVVQLVTPHAELGLRTSTHIPSFARRFASFEGETGDDRAAQLLRNLYSIAVFIEAHRQELRRRWYALREGLRVTLDIRSAESVRTPRTVLRRQLRAGQISSTEYQRVLKRERDELDARYLEREAALDTLWSGFDVDVAGVRDQVMRLIESEPHSGEGEG